MVTVNPSMITVTACCEWTPVDDSKEWLIGKKVNVTVVDPFDVKKKKKKNGCTGGCEDDGSENVYTPEVTWTVGPIPSLQEPGDKEVQIMGKSVVSQPEGGCADQYGDEGTGKLILRVVPRASGCDTLPALPGKYTHTYTVGGGGGALRQNTDEHTASWKSDGELVHGCGSISYDQERSVTETRDKGATFEFDWKFITFAGTWGSGTSRTTTVHILASKSKPCFHIVANLFLKEETVVQTGYYTDASGVTWGNYGPHTAKAVSSTYEIQYCYN